MTLRPYRIVLILCLFLVAASAVQGATLVVDDDHVQCPAAGFSSITAALAAANATGDTIQVCDGTYTEGTITVSKKVVIAGVNRDATFINVAATANYGFFIETGDVTISNFVIQQIGAITDATGIRYNPVTALDNEVVSNVIIRNFLGGSARGLEIEAGDVNDLTVTNSTFSNNLYGIRMSSNSHVDGFVLSGSTFSSTTNAGDFARIGVYQTNDGATSTLRDLQASGNTFANLSLAGMFFEEIRDSQITTSQFTGNYTGIIIDKRYVNSNTPVAGVHIANNTFTNNTGRAIYISALTLGLGSDVVVSGNMFNTRLAALLGPTNRGVITTNFVGTLTHQPLTISGNAFNFSDAFTTATATWGVQLVGDGPVNIEGNVFHGNHMPATGTPPSAAIYIQSNSSAYGARMDAVSITCNDILDFPHGITVYDGVANQGGNLATASVAAHSNNIAGNSPYGIFNGTTPGASATIDATGNWWGSPSGPSGAGPGSGDAISANVDGSAFLSGPQSGCTALSITKSGAPNPVVPGQQLTYTITVSNAGVGDATGVVVHDTLPPSLQNVTSSGCNEDPSGGTTCTLGTITAGSSKSYTLIGTVSGDAPATITNSATLSATGVPADEFDDTATTQTTVSIGADLHISKTVVTPGPIFQTQTIVFNIGVSNNGPSNATGVAVSDVLPPGLQFVDSPCLSAAGSTLTWTIGALASGASTNCQFRAKVLASGPISNTATVSGSPADPGGPDSSTVAFTARPAEEIPALGGSALMLLAAFLAMAGLFIGRH